MSVLENFTKNIKTFAYSLVVANSFNWFCSVRSYSVQKCKRQGHEEGGIS